MRNHHHKLIFIFFALIVLSGCLSKEEIEKKAYVVAIGMDRAESENEIKVTYLITNPEYASQQQGGGSEEPPTEIISFETNDIISSRNTANTVIAKEISYELLRTFAVSEELAQEENFIRWMYDATKDTEIRRDINFFRHKRTNIRFLHQPKTKA
ncbi:hypothetical protein ACLIA0_14060 [Bacillaceae bacterium W0354]